MEISKAEAAVCSFRFLLPILLPCAMIKEKGGVFVLFELGNYILDIDVERTKSFYEYAETITDGCDCQGCRNYAAWAATLSEEPKYKLESMGIQLDKTPEVYANCSNGDGSLLYGGFYHLCGRIVRGKDPWRQVTENGKALDDDVFVSITDNYQVAFTEDISLLEKGFPTPVIQMEIIANIPFVLQEKCVFYRCP